MLTTFLLLLFIVALVFIIIFYKIIKSYGILVKVIDVTTGNPVPKVALWKTLSSSLMRTVPLSQETVDLCKKLGPVYTTFSTGKPTVNFSRSEDIKEILKRNDDILRGSAVNLSVPRLFFGTQALTAVNHEAWSTQRTILNRAVASTSVFLEPMQNKVNICLSKWEKEREVTIGHSIQRLTLDVLASCIFGVDFDTMNGKTSEVLDAYNNILKSLTPMTFLFPWYNDLPLPSNKKLKESIAIFDKYCWDMISEKKKLFEKYQETKSEPSNSLIELMLQNGLPDNVIRDNVSLFFLAGHETTSSSLAWLLASLVSKPEVQEKLRKEIFEKVPGDITADVIKDLNYLDCLIRESMRVHPPISAINSRYGTEDMVVGNIKIPKEVSVQIDFISWGYDPNIWGDPENFRPERWFPENITKEQRAAWMPFGYGPRICLGMNFSLFEQKIFLICLMKRFKHIKLASKGEIIPKNSFINFPDTDKLIIEFVPK